MWIVDAISDSDFLVCVGKLSLFANSSSKTWLVIRILVLLQRVLDFKFRNFYSGGLDYEIRIFII